jgi:hypothetical protein
MSDTVTCDGCMLTKPGRDGFLQFLLPHEEGAALRDPLTFLSRTRWDACSAACARVLVDRFEAQYPVRS